MRRVLLPLCLALFACGDDEKSTADTADTTTADTTAPDTTPDTTAPDTTPDTTAPDTTQPDTTAPDTTQPDTTQPDTTQPVVGICPGLSACVSQCGTEACADDCLEEADSEAEEALTTAYIGCLETNACTTSAFPTESEAKAAYECERTNCLAAKTSCETGDTHGAATCRATAQCLQACDEFDLACARACFSAATELAATAFFDLALCLERECYGQANFQTCSQQATSAVGPCSLTYNGCYGDTGAAPGAGGGGGLPGAD